MQHDSKSYPGKLTWVKPLKRPTFVWIWLDIWRASCGRIHAHNCPRHGWREQVSKVRNDPKMTQDDTCKRIKHQRPWQPWEISYASGSAATVPSQSFPPSAQSEKSESLLNNTKVCKEQEHRWVSENSPKQTSLSPSARVWQVDTAYQRQSTSLTSRNLSADNHWQLHVTWFSMVLVVHGQK